MWNLNRCLFNLNGSFWFLFDLNRPFRILLILKGLYFYLYAFFTHILDNIKTFEIFIIFRIQFIFNFAIIHYVPFVYETWWFHIGFWVNILYNTFFNIAYIVIESLWLLAHSVQASVVERVVIFLLGDEIYHLHRWPQILKLFKVVIKLLFFLLVLTQ
jgi:hypothetical protein